MFVKLRGRPCLVVGGGEVAARKVDLILRAGASLRLVAPDLCDELRRRHAEGEFEHLARRFEDADVRSIGLAKIQRFYDHCIDTGRPRSAKSIDMALNVLRLILSHARGQGLVETNAVEAWKSGRP